MKSIILNIVFGCIVSCLRGQELFIFEEIDNSYSVSKGDQIGNYIRLADQLLFEMNLDNSFECQRIGNIIQFKSETEIGNFLAIGKRAIVFENQDYSIYFEKQGADLLIIYNNEFYTASKIGNAFILEQQGALREDVIYKLGVVLSYHLL